jgi:hypothetical protein
VPKLYRCDSCQAIAEADPPPATCPAAGCGGDRLQEVEVIHFHPPGPGAKRACDGKPVTNGVASGLASVVTCPRCRATFTTPPAPPHPAEV